MKEMVGNGGRLCGDGKGSQDWKAQEEWKERRNKKHQDSMYMCTNFTK